MDGGEVKSDQSHSVSIFELLDTWTQSLKKYIMEGFLAKFFVYFVAFSSFEGEYL